MSAITNSTYQVCNFVRQHTPRIVPPERVLQNIQKIALPAIALGTLATLPGVDGGPWAACICIAACVPLAEVPPLFAACLSACGVALTLPTP